MRQTLILHPDTPCPAVTGIAVEASRSGGLLTLNYLVTGDIGQLALPEQSGAVRADRLWEHSCFEAFVGKEEDYLEVNLAPSGAWAAYRFHGWRDGKYDAAIDPPRISTVRTADRFALRAEVRIDWWAGPLGLSAVIAETNGNTSYWALAHPPGVPDFHNETCFALELPAADGP